MGSGSRRLEALVGIEAFRSLATERALVARLGELLKSPKDSIEDRLTSTIEELKSAQRKLGQLQAAELATRVPALVSGAETVGAFKVVAENFGLLDSVDDLRSLATQVRDRFGDQSAVSAIFGVISDKPMLVIATTKSAQSAGAKAGALVRVASAVLGGGGGGKDDIAQGGGSDVSKITEAISAMKASL